MYDGRDQRRTGVRVVRVEQIHPLWACKPAHEEGESDPRAWVEEQKSTSTDHADRCTARSSLQLTTPRSLSECVLKLRASCGLALALRRDGICSLEGHQGPTPLAINCHPLVESRWQIVWQRDIGDLMPLRPPPEPLCSPVPTQAKPKQAVLPRQSQTPTAGQA